MENLMSAGSRPMGGTSRTSIGIVKAAMTTAAPADDTMTSRVVCSVG
jgi:hypothetical protein